MSCYLTTYNPSLTAYTNVTCNQNSPLDTLSSLSGYIAKSSVPSISGTTLTLPILPTSNSIININTSIDGAFSSSNLIMHQNVFDGDTFILANIPGSIGTGGSTGTVVDLINGNTGTFNVDSTSIIGYNTKIGIEVTSGNKNVSLNGNTGNTTNNWTAIVGMTGAYDKSTERAAEIYNNNNASVFSVQFTASGNLLCTQYKTDGSTLNSAGTEWDTDISMNVSKDNYTDNTGNTSVTALAFGQYMLEQPNLTNVLINNDMTNIYNSDFTINVNSDTTDTFETYFNESNEMKDDYYWQVKQTAIGAGYSLTSDAMVTSLVSSVTQNKDYMQMLSDKLHTLTVTNASVLCDSPYITLDDTAETLGLLEYYKNSYVYFKTKEQGSTGLTAGRSYVNSNTINGTSKPTVYIQYGDDNGIPTNNNSTTLTGATGLTGNGMTKETVNYTVNVIAGSSNQYYTQNNTQSNYVYADQNSSLLLNEYDGNTVDVSCTLGDIDYLSNNNITKFEADIEISRTYTNIGVTDLSVYGVTGITIDYSSGTACTFSGTNSSCTNALMTNIASNTMTESTIFPKIKASAFGTGEKTQFPQNFALQIFAKCGDSIKYDLVLTPSAGDWDLGVGSTSSLSVNSNTPLDTDGSNISNSIMHSLTKGIFPGRNTTNSIDGFKIYPVATNRTVNMFIDIVDINNGVLSTSGPYSLKNVAKETSTTTITGTIGTYYKYTVPAGTFKLNLGAYDNLYVEYPTFNVVYDTAFVSDSAVSTYSSITEITSIIHPLQVNLKVKFNNNFNALLTHYAQFTTTSDSMIFGTGDSFNISTTNNTMGSIDLWYNENITTTLANGRENIALTFEYTDTGKILDGTTMLWLNLNTATNNYALSNYNLYNSSANLVTNILLKLEVIANATTNNVTSLTLKTNNSDNATLATISFGSSSSPHNHYHLYWCPKTIFTATATDATNTLYNTQPIVLFGQTTNLYNNTNNDWLTVDIGVYLLYNPSTVYTGTMMFSLSNDMYCHYNEISANLSISDSSYNAVGDMDIMVWNSLGNTGEGYMNFKLNQYRGACKNRTNIYIRITRIGAEATFTIDTNTTSDIPIYNGVSYYVTYSGTNLVLSSNNTNSIGIKLNFSQSYTKDSDYTSTQLTKDYPIMLDFNTYQIISQNNTSIRYQNIITPNNGVIGTVGNITYHTTSESYATTTPYTIKVQSIYGGSVGKVFKVQPDIQNYRYKLYKQTANNNTYNDRAITESDPTLLSYSTLKSTYKIQNTFIKLIKDSSIPSSAKKYYFQFAVPKFTATSISGSVSNMTKNVDNTYFTMGSNTYKPFETTMSNNVTYTNSTQFTTVGQYFDYVYNDFGSTYFNLNSPNVKLYQNYVASTPNGTTGSGNLVYSGTINELRNLANSTVNDSTNTYKLSTSNSSDTSIIKATFLQDYTKFGLSNEDNYLVVNIPKIIYYNGNDGLYTSCSANVINTASKMCAMGSIINRNTYGFPTSVDVLVYTTDSYSSSIYTLSSTNTVTTTTNGLTTISFPFTNVYKTRYNVNTSALSTTSCNFNNLITNITGLSVSPPISSPTFVDTPFTWTTYNDNWVTSSTPNLPTLPMIFITPINKNGSDALDTFVRNTDGVEKINMCVSRTTPIRVIIDAAKNIIAEIDEAGNFVGTSIDIHS